MRGLVLEIGRRATNYEQDKEAHKRFSELLGLGMVKPFPYTFDGMLGNVAYDLDLGEGWLDIAVLKAIFYKLALRRRLKGVRYYVRENFPSGINTYKSMKQKSRSLSRILRRQGIDLEVIPVRLLVTKTRSKRRPKIA
jgi:hypothetical protein